MSTSAVRDSASARVPPTHPTPITAASTCLTLAFSLICPTVPSMTALPSAMSFSACSQRSAARFQPRARATLRFPSREREMERREAPGVCEAPCTPLAIGACRAPRTPLRHHRRFVRLSGRGCEAQPEARASRNGGFAKPTTRTLRLPALHRGTLSVPPGSVFAALHERATQPDAGGFAHIPM